VVLTHVADRSTKDIIRYNKKRDHTINPQHCINALGIVLRQVREGGGSGSSSRRSSNRVLGQKVEVTMKASYHPPHVILPPPVLTIPSRL